MNTMRSKKNIRDLINIHRNQGSKNYTTKSVFKFAGSLRVITS